MRVKAKMKKRNYSTPDSGSIDLLFDDVAFYDANLYL